MWWKGEFTDELKELFERYFQMFNGYPDEYEDVAYEFFTEEEFCYCIKICLEKKLEFGELFPKKSPWFDNPCDDSNAIWNIDPEWWEAHK